MLDSLSEGITNAVRHGGPSDLDVTIESNQGRITLIARSKGELQGGIGNGTGLARLRDRGAEVCVESEDDSVVLTVRT